MDPLDAIRNSVRKIMHLFAAGLNKLSGGKLTPNTVTMVGLLAHLPIAYLIATRHNLKAAALLVIFGLFDTLDGELARLQKRTSTTGMLLDSITDRAKEVMLYTGSAYVISVGERPLMVAWATAACGAALLVSYVNAWGEAVMTRVNHKNHTTNKAFRIGFMTFEVRMVVIILGLLSNHIILAMVVIASLGALTALLRFVNITTRLHVQD